MTSQKLERMRSNCGGEAMCAVCQEDYVVGKKLMQLPCDHSFCVDCAMQWLRRNKTCPVCRSEVQDDEGEGSDTDWHSRELFPFRLPQGSPLAAVRGAREANEGGAAELWPPVDDMLRIAEMHSAATSIRPQREVSLPRLPHATDSVASNGHVTALELSTSTDEETLLGRTSPISTGVAHQDTQQQRNVQSERGEQSVLATPPVRSTGATVDRGPRPPRGSTSSDASHSSTVRARAPANPPSRLPISQSTRRGRVRNNVAAEPELQSPPRSRLRNSRS